MIFVDRVGWPRDISKTSEQFLLLGNSIFYTPVPVRPGVAEVVKIVAYPDSKVVIYAIYLFYWANKPNAKLIKIKVDACGTCPYLTCN